MSNEGRSVVVYRKSQQQQQQFQLRMVGNFASMLGFNMRL